MSLKKEERKRLDWNDYIRRYYLNKNKLFGVTCNICHLTYHYRSFINEHGNIVLRCPACRSGSAIATEKVRSRRNKEDRRAVLMYQQIESMIQAEKYRNDPEARRARSAYQRRHWKRYSKKVNPEKRERWKNDPEFRKQKQGYQKGMIKRVADGYARGILRRKGFCEEALTPEMVEAQRQLILTYRTIINHAKS